jgi:hypothetical protein
MTSPRRGRTGGDAPAGAGGATMRGALLIAVAVIAGVILLGTGFDRDAVTSTGDDPSDQASGNGDGNGDDEGDGGDEETTTTTAPPTTHVPAQVRVIVLNGGGPTGSAGTSSTALTAAGYTAREPGDTADVPASVVYFNPGFDADAAAVATTLRIGAAPQPMPATPPEGAPAPTEVDVVVVLGPEFTPVA